MMMALKNTRQMVAPPVAQFRVVSEHEAALRLSLGRRTLQDLRLTGAGPAFIKLGARRIGYSITDLEAWAADRRVSSTSAAAVRV